MSMYETWHGYVESTHDAFLVFEACLSGMLSKVPKRLDDQERKKIRSGSIFVFDEHSSKIKRWTDGRLWSPSRILGNFLVYREVDKKGPPPKNLSEYNFPAGNVRGSLSKDLDTNNNQPLTSQKGTYYFKEGGLIKKTISVEIKGIHLHLVSYYRKEDVESGLLTTPSDSPQLASLIISGDLQIENSGLGKSKGLNTPLSSLARRPSSLAPDDRSSMRDSPMSAESSPRKSSIQSLSNVASALSSTNLSANDLQYLPRMQMPPPGRNPDMRNRTPQYINSAPAPPTYPQNPGPMPMTYMTWPPVPIISQHNNPIPQLPTIPSGSELALHRSNSSLGHHNRAASGNLFGGNNNPSFSNPQHSFPSYQDNMNQHLGYAQKLPHQPAQNHASLAVLHTNSFNNMSNGGLAQFRSASRQSLDNGNAKQELDLLSILDSNKFSNSQDQFQPHYALSAAGAGVNGSQSVGPTQSMSKVDLSTLSDIVLQHHAYEESMKHPGSASADLSSLLNGPMSSSPKSQQRPTQNAMFSAGNQI